MSLRPPKLEHFNEEVYHCGSCGGAFTPDYIPSDWELIVHQERVEICNTCYSKAGRELKESGFIANEVTFEQQEEEIKRRLIKKTLLRREELAKC